MNSSIWPSSFGSSGRDLCRIDPPAVEAARAHELRPRRGVLSAWRNMRPVVGRGLARGGQVKTKDTTPRPPPPARARGPGGFHGACVSSGALGAAGRNCFGRI